MVQAPNAPPVAPAQSKFSTVVRAAGLGVLVLILWSMDKFAAGHLAQGSVWRYVIGGVIILVGMMIVLSIGERLSKKES